MMSAPPDLSAVRLLDPDGKPCPLDSSGSDFLVIQLVRYFGCLPCQQWLIDLDKACGEFTALGARAIAVGGSADYQARWLRDERGVQLPLFLDPDQRMRNALQIGRLGGRLLDPRGLASYSQAIRSGLRPHQITRDTVQAPGIVILDARLNEQWRHVGTRIGDYPPLSDVIAVVRSLASS